MWMTFTTYNLKPFLYKRHREANKKTRNSTF